MVSGDTIAAVATPPGRGGIGVVRVSGPAVATIARALLGSLPAARYALHRPFRAADGRPIDRGIALYFQGPLSYTGEDVLELQGHGGPVVMDQLLAQVLALGARLARPGEFTERAFLNGKLDLAQAEAVADLIDSHSAAAARAALESLQGGFSRQIQALVGGVTELRAFVEAALDFPDEDLDFLSDGRIGQRLGALGRDLQALQAAARQGQRLRDGMRLAIVGAPNVGKSSLLNALVGRDSAIVTAIPGTTRDLLRESLELDGMPLHITDTAGLRDSIDPVEQEGIRRAREEMARADGIVWVVDHSAGECPPLDAVPGLPEALAAGAGKLVVVLNKIDLTGAPPGRRIPGISHVGGSAPGAPLEVCVSAKTGAGLDALRQCLKGIAGYSGGEGAFSARRRHLHALSQASEALAMAQGLLSGGSAAELVAEELRSVQRSLGEITGQVGSDELLGHIFARFCIGK